KLEMVRRAEKTRHSRPDDRAGSRSVKADREPFAHAAGPVIDEHDDALAIGEWAAGRHELEPAASDACRALLTDENMPLVRRLFCDEAAEDAARDRRVTAAGRVSKVQDQP